MTLPNEKKQRGRLKTKCILTVLLPQVHQSIQNTEQHTMCPSVFGCLRN